MLIFIAMTMICGCSQKPDPKLADMQKQLNAMSARLDELSDTLAHQQRVQIDQGNGMTFLMTNMEHLITKDIVEVTLEREHLLKDPATRDQYSPTNNPSKLNPATGLPWLPGEK